MGLHLTFFGIIHNQWTVLTQSKTSTNVPVGCCSRITSFAILIFGTIPFAVMGSLAFLVGRICCCKRGQLPSEGSKTAQVALESLTPPKQVSHEAAPKQSSETSIPVSPETENTPSEVVSSSDQYVQIPSDTTITKLEIREKKAIALPILMGYKRLQELDLQGNELIYIPGLSGVYGLKILHVENIRGVNDSILPHRVIQPIINWATEKLYNRIAYLDKYLEDHPNSKPPHFEQQRLYIKGAKIGKNHLKQLEEIYKHKRNRDAQGAPFVYVDIFAMEDNTHVRSDSMGSIADLEMETGRGGTLLAAPAEADAGRGLTLLATSAIGELSTTKTRLKEACQKTLDKSCEELKAIMEHRKAENATQEDNARGAQLANLLEQLPIGQQAIEAISTEDDLSRWNEEYGEYLIYTELYV